MGRFIYLVIKDLNNEARAGVPCNVTRRGCTCVVVATYTTKSGRNNSQRRLLAVAACSRGRPSPPVAVAARGRPSPPVAVPPVAARGRPSPPVAVAARRRPWPPVAVAARGRGRPWPPVAILEPFLGNVKLIF